jgi:hypothetical protein
MSTPKILSPKNGELCIYQINDPRIIYYILVYLFYSPGTGYQKVITNKSKIFYMMIVASNSAKLVSQTAFSCLSSLAVKNFPKNYKPSQNSSCQNDDMKQVPYEDPQTTGTTVQDLVVTSNCCPGFVHPCSSLYVEWKWYKDVVSMRQTTRYTANVYRNFNF